MLCGRKIELVDNIRKRDIRHRQAVFDVFRPLLNQPSVHRNIEFLFEHPAEGMHAVAAKPRQLLRIVGFAIMRHNKALEWHLLVRHRVKKRMQLSRRIVAGEEPDKFFVLHLPEGTVVCSLRQIREDTLYERLQRGVTQCRAATFAPTGHEHHFARTQYFVMEQRACDTDTPCPAENQIVGLPVLVARGHSRRDALQLEQTIRSGFCAKCRGGFRCIFHKNSQMRLRFSNRYSLLVCTSAMSSTYRP